VHFRQQILLAAFVNFPEDKMQADKNKKAGVKMKVWKCPNCKDVLQNYGLKSAVIKTLLGEAYAHTFRVMVCGSCGAFYCIDASEIKTPENIWNLHKPVELSGCVSKLEVLL
jgi:uncharacterized protein with PIN domain